LLYDLAELLARYQKLQFTELSENLLKNESLFFVEVFTKLTL